MKLIKKLLSAFLVDYARVLSYMLQQSEYSVLHFMRWWVRIDTFRGVAKRGDYIATDNSRKIRALIGGTIGAYWVLNLIIIFLSLDLLILVVSISGLTIILYPIVVALSTTIIVYVLGLLRRPAQKKRILAARSKLSSHSAIVIAVAGSYAKTTMKEMLQHLLDGSLRYAVTEGNKNTLMSQVKLIEGLSGEEEVLIVELGEGAPGDVAKMVELLQPDYAVITGLAPNHLESYRTIDALVGDFSALAQFVGPERTFINSDSMLLEENLGTLGTSYGSSEFDGWIVKNVDVELADISFTAQQGKKSLHIHAAFVGRHTVGPLLFACILALRLGVNENELKNRLGSLRPFEHRMEPRNIGGALMIDDTYNGNIEGMRAGLAYLKEIKPGGRKIYVTPGLVDQGALTEKVHKELGAAIADAQPDEVYLMSNSVTAYIKKALEEHGYQGKIQEVNEPLSFYLHLGDIVAAGDVVLCQNDWPDNYA